MTNDDDRTEVGSVEVEVLDTTIRATDDMGNTVEVETSGWNATDYEHTFPQEMDAVVTGRVSTLAVDAKFPQLSGIDENAELVTSYPLDTGEGVELPPGQYHLSVEPPVATTVRFPGPATVTLTSDDDIRVAFDQPEPVSVGFSSLLQYPRHTVTVPRTTAGLATAISQFSSSLRTTDCRRSSDRSRRHPPAIAFGDEVSIPDAVADHVPNTGLRLCVPDRVDALLQAAPLAYYLGAEVALVDGPPTIEAVDGGFEYAFEGPPRFQAEVAAVLRRLFLVDRLVYYDQEVSEPPRDAAVLDDLDLETATYDSLSDVERLRTVLDLNFEAVSPRLPEWHVATFVEPTFENATALPHLLQYLSVVFDPASYPTGAGDGSPLSEPAYADTIPERVREPTPHGSAIGWIASESPPDERPFVARPEGFANATRYIKRDEGAGRIVVVCNDGSRRAVARTVAERYRAHTPPSVETETYTDLDRGELAALFEQGADFLHFVGDAADGFACADGRLTPADIGTSNVRLLFLDAPRSTETTLACLRHGSVGGFAVDGDEPPTPAVREALTGLFVRGCTAEQAARYANATGESGTTVVAVGNAFQQLVRSMTLYCTTGTVEPTGRNEFAVTVYPYIPRAGFVWRPERLDVPAQFCAQPCELTVSGPELESLIDTENLIPVYDGGVHWDDRTDFFNPLL